ncbi:MAG: hypothetical protein ACK4GG_04025 [Sphingomonas sp.]
MIRLAGLTIALSALAACGDKAPDNATGNIATEAMLNEAEASVSNTTVPAAAPTASVALNLAPGGLMLADMNSGRSVQQEFGIGGRGLLALAGAVLGKSTETGTNRECGEGAMDFAKFDGLTLWFQEDKFVGWFLDGAKPKLTTGTGAGIGSTRAQVADGLAISDVPDSSLGREFTTEGGGLSGMLDGAGDGAKVTALWSGQACIFR